MTSSNDSSPLSLTGPTAEDIPIINVEKVRPSRHLSLRWPFVTASTISDSRDDLPAPAHCVLPIAEAG
jgi:hypothetical protein